MEQQKSYVYPEVPAGKPRLPCARTHYQEMNEMKITKKKYFKYYNFCESDQIISQKIKITIY